jgi:hypothetical protein
MGKTLLRIGMGMAFACGAVSVRAANPNPNTTTPNNNNTNKKQNLQYPPAVDTSAAVADLKKLTEAKSTLSHAQQKLNAIVDKLKAVFEETPARKSTVTAGQRIQGHYDSVRGRVVSALHDSAAYKSAIQDRDQLVVQLASSGGDEDHFHAAQQKLEANKKITALEMEALSADSSFVDAQAKLTEIASKLAQQLAEFQQSITTNKDWMAAKDELDKAKTEVDADEKEYTAELAKETEAQKERAAAVAAIDRQRMEQSGKSGSRRGY